MTLTLSIVEQLIAAEQKMSRALIGSEVCGRRKEGPVEMGSAISLSRKRALVFASALNASGNPSVSINALPGAVSSLHPRSRNARR
jgi:hypothetical protein